MIKHDQLRFSDIKSPEDSARLTNPYAMELVAELNRPANLKLRYSVNWSTQFFGEFLDGPIK
jgi:hypothetical protein